MSFLKVSGVSKRQQGGLVVDEVSFSLERFQKIAIAGETGSGKSTLLKIVGGLAQADAGEVIFENQRVLGPEEKLLPGHKSIAYLSQHFELRNNYRVEEELDYANKLTDEEAANIYKICQIDHLLKRKTDQISGGEKQRIAMARLLISSPKLFLLDEPFSNLDIIHKNVLKTVIRNVGEQLSITFMLISHDPLDTLSWADEIIVMQDGKVVQHGAPLQIYKQPIDEYVAGLFGKYNLVKSELVNKPGDQSQLQGKKLFTRPEDLKITPGGIPGKVAEISFLGSGYELGVLIDDEMLTALYDKGDVAKGDSVGIAISSNTPHYL